MNIVLFGIKGCGKTTFGKLVANKLNRAFNDTDHLLEQTYQMKRKKKLSCREIYEEVGPVTFRSLEYEVIQSLQDIQQSVIAVGGGAMLLYENIEALKKNSQLFYLFFEREALKKRVLAMTPLPVFINPDDPEATFDKMYDERDDFYKKIGSELIDITTLSDDEVVQKICEKHGKQ